MQADYSGDRAGVMPPDPLPGEIRTYNPGVDPTDPAWDDPKCHWLIRVASGCLEPDFPEDLWTEVECGAPLTINEYGSWKCEAGHEYVTYDDPARGAWDAEQAFRERFED